ncbi:KTSC domain-containing protein [Candidatus Peregrinibacteria bacterium]|jgi:hypothetical protein|nr:KTSC domain-containing protein [Candidatus Peregrinibacteria bacterium]
MKKILLILSTIVLLSGCSSDQNYKVTPEADNIDYESYFQTEEHTPIVVSVKYRDDAVDVGHPRFEYLNTSGSSFVRGAWYDDDNQYMVIKLNSTYYHYCGMPSVTWTTFKNANSFGTTYNSAIKGSYDCRYNYMPNY